MFTIIPVLFPKKINCNLSIRSGIFYHNDPYFVPPLIMDRKKLLNKKKNPFYKHSGMRPVDGAGTW